MKKGFTLIELMIVVAIIGILALIAIPNFIQLRERAYDASAQSAGRNAKLSEEIYINDHGGDISGGYASQLADLLLYDKNLTDDTAVTFTFAGVSSSHYTVLTNHTNSSTTPFAFSD